MPFSQPQAVHNKFLPAGRECCCLLRNNHGRAASLTSPDLKGHTHGGKTVGKKVSMGEEDFSEDH